MLLRIISYIILIGTFVWLYFIFKSNKGDLKNAWQWFLNELKALWNDIKNLKTLKWADWIKNFKKYLYLIAYLCFIVLALSGLIPYLLGIHLTGYLLLIHVAVTPLFALCLVIIALIWAHEHRFNQKNWEWIQKNIFLKPNRQEPAGKNELLAKLFFWLILVFGMFLTSIVLSMYPILGSDGQKFLLDFHKFSAVVITAFVALHTCVMIQMKKTEVTAK
jgi:cytochrome b subunit of formate dehydrogenase